MPKHPRIIFRLHQLTGLFVAEFFKVGLEHEDAIVWIAEMSRLSRDATVMTSVTAHHAEDSGVGDRLLNLAQQRQFRPSPQAIETIRTQVVDSLRCPLRLALVLLSKSIA